MIIFKHKNHYPAMPSIALAADGNLVAVFRDAPREKKGYTHLHSLSTIMLTRSTDNGKSWTKPAEIGMEDLPAKQDPHLFVTSSGKVLLYYFRYLFHPESELAEIERNRELVYIHAKKKRTIATLRGLGLMSSIDNGQSFSKPEPISLPGVVSCAVRGRAVQLPNSTVLQATYARKRNGRYCIDLIASSDEGKTWYIKTRDIASTRRRKGTVTEYVEPSLLLTPEGGLHLFIRTHEGDHQAYTSYCYSGDSGTSFSRPKKTSIEGYPLDPLLLSDGRVLLTYGWRKKKPFGVRYRMIEPDLRNLSSAEEHILDSSSTVPDCGYPWAIQTDSNRVFVAYYSCGPDGIRRIAGSVIPV